MRAPNAMTEDGRHAVTGWPQITPRGAFDEGLRLVCVWFAMPAATLMIRTGGADLPGYTAPACFASAALAATAYALVLRAERAHRLALGLNRHGAHDASLASFERRCLASLPCVSITLLLVWPWARGTVAALLLVECALMLSTVRRSQKFCASLRGMPTADSPSAPEPPQTFKLGALIEFDDGAVCWTSEAAFLRTSGGTLVLDSTAPATYAATPEHHVRLVRFASGFIASAFPRGEVPRRSDADLPESVIVIENQ